jgi:hypothetical protein
MAVFVHLPDGIYPDSNPSPFGTAVKHFYFFAIDAELKDEKGNRIIRIIVVHNSNHHGIPLHLNVPVEKHSIPGIYFSRIFYENGNCMQKKLSQIFSGDSFVLVSL